MSLTAYLGPSMPVLDLPGTRTEEGCVPFAAGWYSEGQPEPLRTVARQHAALDDVDVELVRGFGSGCVLTTTGPQPAGDVQPFRWGPLLFGFRGQLDPFEEVFEKPLVSRLSPQALTATRSRSPEAVLFMTWLELLQGNVDTDHLADGLERLVATVQDLALTNQATANFATVVTNGTSLVTLRTGTSDELPPMFTLLGSDETPIPARGRIVTTEQLFPGSWTSLEAHSMVIFTEDT
jgi:hypothetical protein